MVVFTKFDGQIIQECGKLDEIEDDGAKWDIARKNAEITFQKTYLPKIMNAQYPPKAYVRLEGENEAIPCLNRYHVLVDMDITENDCPELSEKTANAIDDSSLQELFVSIQMNNLDLCVKLGLGWVSHQSVFLLIKCGVSRHVLERKETSLEAAFIIVLSKFPHYWVLTKHSSSGYDKTKLKSDCQKSKYILERCNMAVIVYYWKLQG